MRTLAEIITRLSAFIEQSNTDAGYHALPDVQMPREEETVSAPIPSYETLMFWATKHYQGKLSAEEISLLLNYYLLTLACHAAEAPNRPRAVHDETLYHFKALLDEFAH